VILALDFMRWELSMLGGDERGWGHVQWVRGRTRNPKGERGARKEDCSHSGHRTWLSRAGGSMCV
jgi:hypothetical protein